MLSIQINYIYRFPTKKLLVYIYICCIMLDGVKPHMYKLINKCDKDYKNMIGIT